MPNSGLNETARKSDSRNSGLSVRELAYADLPLIISIDTKGNNLIEENKKRFNEKKRPVMEKIYEHVRSIK